MQCLLQMTASALVCPGLLAPAQLLLASVTCGIQTQDYSFVHNFCSQVHSLNLNVPSVSFSGTR